MSSTGPEAWESDLQFNSMYQEKKSVIAQEQEDYLQAHPEVRNMLRDFMQHVLVHRPQDTFAAAEAYFAAFRGGDATT